MMSTVDKSQQNAPTVERIIRQVQRNILYGTKEEKFYEQNTQNDISFVEARKIVEQQKTLPGVSLTHCCFVV